MHFTTTSLPQVTLIDLNRQVDDRGFFARAWCGRELTECGLDGRCAQASLSFNRRRGTLRGMHYQAAPHAEAKCVRVIRGAVHDVVLDLRDDSPTRGQWFACELTAGNRRALFVPAGCAHGFLTLTDDAELLYLISVPFVADAARGVHWDTPQLNGAWPFTPSIVSVRDQRLPRELPAPNPVFPSLEGLLPPGESPTYNPLDGDH
jgi:dTDP-4-dehydrorhamnose 3,5-epimerase